MINTGEWTDDDTRPERVIVYVSTDAYDSYKVEPPAPPASDAELVAALEDIESTAEAALGIDDDDGEPG